MAADIKRGFAQMQTQMTTQIFADRQCGFSRIIRGNLRRRYPRPSALRAQASLEATFALLGAVLLLLASFKVFLWMNARLITRQVNYQRGVTEAGIGGKEAATAARTYVGVVEPSDPLNILNENRR